MPDSRVHGLNSDRLVGPVTLTHSRFERLHMEDRCYDLVPLVHRCDGRFDPSDFAGDGRVREVTAMIFPVTVAEELALVWASRIVPAVAAAVILLMSAISVAAA